MLQASRRTTIRGPAFIRLLARLTAMDVTPPHLSLSDRLSQWLDWNHALALSTALDGKPSVVTVVVSAPALVAQDTCARARASQAEAVTDETEWSVGQRRADDAVADYAFFRQRYLARQRAMRSATGDLRGRLRETLAAQSADMARLAEVDAAMELALSPREQALLAAVPDLLESHFQNLRQAALADAQIPSMRGSWQSVFRKDMQSVLLAELDVRFQPVEALLAALRTS